MSKGKIITFSIIGFIIVLNTILFGAVFRLRKQNVVIGEDITYTSKEIVDAAGLKNGKSIFLIDKDKAISNIEAKYADLKVVQIKTTSVTEIEIKVRKRYETYYIKNLGNYYILDQDLKVLEIFTDEETEKVTQADSLVQIKTKLHGLDAETKLADFIGNSHQQNMCYNLFAAVYTTQMPEKETGSAAHLKFASILEEISFDTGYTASGESYNRLIVKTKLGMKFDIGKATNEMERKINLCFTAMNNEQITDKTIGTITIAYDEQGKEIKTYSDGIE